jgi:hypothetical protein
VLWFLVTLALAAVIGSLLSIPDREAGLGRWGISVGITVGACVVAWIATDALGMGKTDVGPWAHVVVSLIFASAAASIYHAYVAKSPPLR